ncbi:hypothetical protein Dimus_037535 [Dionaea muscipula]
MRGICMANGEEAKATAVKELKDIFVLLEEAFLKSSGEAKPFFGGDEIGYLDLHLGPSLDGSRSWRSPSTSCCWRRPPSLALFHGLTASASTLPSRMNCPTPTNCSSLLRTSYFPG